MNEMELRVVIYRTTYKKKSETWFQPLSLFSLELNLCLMGKEFVSTTKIF
jgi:hypothetical protein